MSYSWPPESPKKAEEWGLTMVDADWKIQDWIKTLVGL